jgi:hypothetical protein
VRWSSLRIFTVRDNSRDARRRFSVKRDTSAKAHLWTVDTDNLMRGGKCRAPEMM